jgi:hypothetical protein
MHIAARSVLLLPLTLILLALPARAQTGAPARDLPPDVISPEPSSQKTEPAAPSLPPETLPPEPAAEPAAPAPPTPESPTAPPDYQLRPPEYPLSAQILQVHLSYGWNLIQVSRGGVEEPDILRAVGGSDRATRLVDSGQREVTTGRITAFAGTVVIIGSLIGAIAVAANNPNPTTQQADNIGAGFATGVLAGAVLEIVGDIILTGGYHDIAEGINAYNTDLLDDRLGAPGGPAVPQR